MGSVGVTIGTLLAIAIPVFVTQYVFVDWTKVGEMAFHSLTTTFSEAMSAIVSLAGGIVACLLMLLLARAIVESVYMVAHVPCDTHDVTWAVVTGVIASSVASLLAFWQMLPQAVADVPWAILCVIMTLLIVLETNRHVDVMSITVDATRHDVVSVGVYPTGSPKPTWYGLTPIYRKARRAARRYQMVGVSSLMCLVIGDCEELDAVTGALPDGAPLRTFLIDRKTNVTDTNGPAFPVGVLYVIDVNKAKFATVKSQKLTRRPPARLISTDEFMASRRRFAGIVRPNVAMSSVNSPETTAKVERRIIARKAEIERVNTSRQPDATIVNLHDHTGDTDAGILLPDQSGVIPITPEIVDNAIPVVQPDQDGSLNHSNLAKIIDVNAISNASNVLDDIKDNKPSLIMPSRDVSTGDSTNATSSASEKAQGVDTKEKATASVGTKKRTTTRKPRTKR